MSADSETKRSARSAVLSSRPEYERFGKWLRQERLSAGKTQLQVCQALGKPAEFMSKVEHGKQRLDLIEFLDLAEFAGLSPETTVRDLLAIIRLP